ncbi:MAG TPA: prepilin-type N-terminal cleavage/methylation domain-containing protein [Gemmatimonadaceae bacterium]|nr:prepilin-type N-terminal cleavage/methylation domain-containing protein [Gemmatimonadaceae bacterium]
MTRLQRSTSLASPSRPRPSRRGFTLIELLTVFVIAGLLMGITARGIGPMIMQQRLDKAANAMTNDLRVAFAMSARNRHPIRVTVDTTRMLLSVTDRAQGIVLRKTTFGSDFGLKSANVASIYPTSPVEIYPNGLASDSLVISFRSGSYHRQVWVSRAGMVQVRTR